MAAHSKFTIARATTAVEVLAAGGSRREAARRIGVDHQTLSRWIARGDRLAGTGCRVAVFAEAVHLAETPTEPPILVPLKPVRPTREEVEQAWRLLEELEPGFAPRPDPEPISVVVAFSAFPPTGKDPA